jgi:hypothetical protein
MGRRSPSGPRALGVGLGFRQFAKIVHRYSASGRQIRDHDVRSIGRNMFISQRQRFACGVLAMPPWRRFPCPNQRNMACVAPSCFARSIAGSSGRRMTVSTAGRSSRPKSPEGSKRPQAPLKTISSSREPAARSPRRTEVGWSFHSSQTSRATQTQPTEPIKKIIHAKILVRHRRCVSNIHRSPVFSIR